MKLSVWLIAAQQVSAQAVQAADWEPDCARRPNGSNHVPGVCTQYYQCAGGKPRSEPVIRECPEGLAFNGKWCVLKDQARCDAKWRLPKEAKEIHQMAAAVLADGSSFAYDDAVDYGCAGRGTFWPFSPTLGKQVDDIDKAFFTWKKCIQCIARDKDAWMAIGSYDFDLATQSCANSSDESRPICQCDYALMMKLYDANAMYTGYNGDECIKNQAPSGLKSECCNWDVFMYASYNPARQCCGNAGVESIGNC